MHQARAERSQIQWLVCLPEPLHMPHTWPICWQQLGGLAFNNEMMCSPETFASTTSSAGWFFSAMSIDVKAVAPRTSCHRRFDFSSERLRCTSVAMHPDGRLAVHVKGSPERLLAFMDPATVPDNFVPLLQLQNPTAAGYPALCTHLNTASPAQNHKEGVFRQ
eukprot:scaffold44484_cov19-Tisochrysis_lutea.AAC.1